LPQALTLKSCLGMGDLIAKVARQAEAQCSRAGIVAIIGIKKLGKTRG